MYPQLQKLFDCPTDLPVLEFLTCVNGILLGSKNSQFRLRGCDLQ
ncbi:TPA: hypothetical protein ACPQZG_000256 [Haemophilus influenzae]|nr:hypothetical protein [Haemophilus influenzae]